MIRRTILGLLLIAVAGGIGYWLAPSPHLSTPEETQHQTLTAQSVVHSEEMMLHRSASRPEEAYELIRRELNRQITIPEIAEMSLTGVTIEEIVAKIRVPIFVYENSDEPVFIYVYNYALLDQRPGQLYLEAGLLRELEEENHFTIEEYSDQHVVIWRHRDDIFAAVTRGNPDSLVQRIQPQRGT